MTYQAYLNTIKAKTGKEPQDFIALAAKEGLVKRSDIMAWLKADYGLGHGHANLIAHLIESEGKPKVTADEKIEAHFKGAKAAWRETYEGLLAQVSAFGPDVRVAPTNSYISLLRNDGKFAIVATTAERLDLGLKLKGVTPGGRLEPSGSWNNMVTHRLRVTNPAQIDGEVLGWLKQAYEAA